MKVMQWLVVGLLVWQPVVSSLEEGECVAGECQSGEEDEVFDIDAAMDALLDQEMLQQQDEVPDANDKAEEAAEEEAEEVAETDDPEKEEEQEEAPAKTEAATSTDKDAEDESSATPPLTMGTPTCPDRDHLMRCAAVHLDTNRNNKLERSELQEAIDKLPWYSKTVLKILGSVDKILKKCDVDQDDAISMDYDMEHNTETCLATCFKRRAFKGAFFPKCEL